MTDNLYIQELLNKLNHTEIGTDSTIRYGNYSEGIQALLDVFSWHKEHQSQVFFIGNGGSSAIASHMTADFMKNGGMNCYSLYDNSVTTCMGNDYGYEYIFSKPMQFLVKEDDLVVAISSSGNSENIVNAIQVAKEKNARVITFTGFEADKRKEALLGIYMYYSFDRWITCEFPMCKWEKYADDGQKNRQSTYWIC